MRILLMIAGGLAGLMLGLGSSGLLGAAMGAVAGFIAAEVVAGRRRMDALERELNDLRRRAATRGRTPVSASGAASASVTGASEGAQADATPGSQGLSAAARDYFGDAAATSAPARGSISESSVAAVGIAAVDARTSAAREADSRKRASTEGAAPQQAAGGHSPPRPTDELAVTRVIREYFTGGNTLVRVGVVILFIGVAFLLRYVAEHTNVPIELRLSGVAVGAVAMLALGWRLRTRRPGYALAIQGGAIGILYLTVFASLRLFHVLPAGAAFAVLVLLAASCAGLAILQSSMAFALLAIGCGFLAPILASSGQGNHIVLFSYYLVLNLGILAIAWFKAWRPLNVVGFLFTFVIGTAWGVLRYRADIFASTEPFLIAFFLLYVAIAILFSLRQRPILRGYVEGTIVFGTPIAAFGLQSAMVHDWKLALAYSAIAVGAMYGLLAWLLHRGKRETQRLLVEAFMALGIAFATLAVPLAFDGRWSAATWALEGAALVWVGCRQQRLLPRVSGALLQIASGIMFMFDVDAPYGHVPLLNSAYLGGVMIAVACVFAVHWLEKARESLRSYEQPFPAVLFFWGLLWWLVSGITEIERHVPDRYFLASVLMFLAGSALISSELHRRLGMHVARIPPLTLLPLMVVFAAVWVVHLSHPFAGAGWLAWPLTFAGFYFLCRRHEALGVPWPVKAFHAVSALLLIALVAGEFAWEVDRAINGRGAWPAIAWALVPAVALYALPKLPAQLRWPVGAHRETYVAIVGSVLAVFLALWSFTTNVSMPGDPYPFPYVPLLNPLDLAQALVLLVLLRHGLHLHGARYPQLQNIKARELVWGLSVLVFVWLNAVLLRTLHHWAGVPYEPGALFRSTLVQTTLTIFWTVLALATMLFATQRGTRIVWIVGAALMAVVIGKLFLIDLSRIGTVERIVSFVGVGLLMLVVGYFSPLPPARKEVA